MEHRVIVATGFGSKGKRKEKKKPYYIVYADGARSQERLTPSTYRRFEMLPVLFVRTEGSGTFNVRTVIERSVIGRPRAFNNTVHSPHSSRSGHPSHGRCSLVVTDQGL